MTIDWRPMTEWPPKKRHHSDQFVFWYPASANGRIVLGAQAHIGPMGGRTPIKWAKIDPPRSDDTVAKDRLLAALGKMNGRYYLENFYWGPRHEDARAEFLAALTGAKVSKSKAGFNAFRAAFYAAVGVDSFSGTPHEVGNEFARRAAAIVAGTRSP